MDERTALDERQTISFRLRGGPPDPNSWGRPAQGSTALPAANDATVAADDAAVGTTAAAGQGTTAVAGQGDDAGGIGREPRRRRHGAKSGTERKRAGRE